LHVDSVNVKDHMTFETFAVTTVPCIVFYQGIKVLSAFWRQQVLTKCWCYFVWHGCSTLMTMQ